MKETNEEIDQEEIINKEVEETQEESRTPLERFIDSNCDTSDFENKILLDEFFSVYSNYLKESKQTQINKPNLGKELKKLGWETKRELVQTTQHNFDGSLKKDLKSFIFGIKISSISRISPTSHSVSYKKTKWEHPVMSDMPDISKGMKEMYENAGLLDEAKEVFKQNENNVQLKAKAGEKNKCIKK